MASRAISGQPRTKKRKLANGNSIQFDFVVAERPQYIPGSGPPLAPLSLLPAHDNEDAIIIDYLVVDGVPKYVVGYKSKPHLRIGVKPQDITDWVSARTVEDWEFEQTNLRLKEEEEALLSKIIAKNERRRKREEKLAQKESRGPKPKKYWSRKRKRPPTPEPAPRRPSARGMGMVFVSEEKATASGPAQRRRLRQVEEPTFISPPRPQNTQPSLSTPSKGRGLADRMATETETDDEDTDVAIEKQMGLNSSRMKGFSRLQVDSSRSASTSPDPLAKVQPASASIPNATSASHNPRRTSNLPYVELPRIGAVAATSSREALKVYEELERKKKSPQKLGTIYQKYSMFAEHPPASSSQYKSSSTSSAQKSKASSFQAVRGIVATDEGEDEDEDGEDEEEGAWEVDKILDEKMRIENGKKRLYYYVDWVGDWDPTWEPADHLEAPEVLAAYQKAKKRRRLALDGADDSSSDEVMMVGTGGLGKVKEKPVGMLRGSDSVAQVSKRAERNGYDASEQEKSDEDTLFVPERHSGSQQGIINRAKDKARATLPERRPDSSKSQIMDKGKGREVGRLEGIYDVEQESDESAELQWQALGVAA